MSTRRSILFAVLKGGHGATYFFNVSSLQDLFQSLRFYQANTPKAKIRKILLTGYLLYCRLNRRTGVSDIDGLTQWLRKNSTAPTSILIFPGHGHFSILLPPTGDKMLLHDHREKLFTKYAWGKSRTKLEREVFVYQHLTEKCPSEFSVPSLCNSAIMSEYAKISLKDFNSCRGKKFGDRHPAQVAGAFSHITTGVFIQASELWERCALPNTSESWKELSRRQNLPDHTIRLGWHHGDFKPWNLARGTPPLLFDFEEFSEQEPEGLDLINFFVEVWFTRKGRRFVLQQLRTSKKFRDELADYQRHSPGHPIFWRFLLEVYWCRKIQQLTAEENFDTANDFLWLKQAWRDISTTSDFEQNLL